MAEAMFGFGRSKTCEFRGNYFREWIFIVNFTEFIFAIDRFEMLQGKMMIK